MTYGTKLGVDAKAGVRIATSIIPSSTQHPRQPKGASQMDVEIAMGYRTHQAFGVGTGLNLNAFRTSIGFYNTVLTMILPTLFALFFAQCSGTGCRAHVADSFCG